MEDLSCYHCGDTIKTCVTFDEKSFCCNGCKTVYEIFSENGLASYYDLDAAPGAAPEKFEGKYDFLGNEQIVEKLLEFNDGNTRSFPCIFHIFTAAPASGSLRTSINLSPRSVLHR